MAIEAFAKFNPEVKWAGGAGCLVCGANVSELGAKIGVQCVDLGLADEFLGRFGICYDHAIQVARVIDFVDKNAVLDLLEEARQLSENAEAMEAAAASEAAQARLDRDTVERLVGPFQPAPEAVSA